jgi:hypothetical protein
MELDVGVPEDLSPRDTEVGVRVRMARRVEDSQTHIDVRQSLHSTMKTGSEERRPRVFVCPPVVEFGSTLINQ